MRRKRREYSIPDKTTQKLLQRRVFTIEMQSGDPELRRFKTKVPYSFSAAVKYILVLSVLLWWLPTLGQMIAGYVGGRRAGSPWKAAVAACVPVAIIYSIIALATHGYFTTEISFLYAIPYMAAQSISNNMPFTAPYIDFLQQYLSTFILYLKSTIGAGLDGYLVTVIFAYLGGIVAQQNLREMTYGRGAGVASRISLGEPVHIPRPMGRTPSWSAAPSKPLESMKRIPVAVGTSSKVQPKKKTKVAKVVKTKQLKEEPTKSSAPAKAEKGGKKKYDKETLNKRLVERALSHYK